MGQKRTVEFKFDQALDQRFAAKVLPHGLLDEMNNCQMSAIGKVERRRGWVNASSSGETLPIGRAIFELDGSLALLTSRRLYALSPGSTAWQAYGPAVTHLQTTPVQSHLVPPAVWSPSGGTSTARNVRRGVLSSECAAIPCDLAGSVTGSFVLVASLSDVATNTAVGSDTEWGYVTLHGYHVWEDDYGHVHWEKVWEWTDTTNLAHQVRGWRCGANLLVGYFTHDEGDASWGLSLACWKPRTSVTTYTTSVLAQYIAEDLAPTQWDVHSNEFLEAGKHQSFIAACFGPYATGAGGIYLWTVDEDMTVVHSALANVPTVAAAPCLAVLWDEYDTPAVQNLHLVYYDPTGDHVTENIYDQHLASRTWHWLASTVTVTPKTISVSIPPEDTTVVRTWYTQEVPDTGLTYSEWYWIQRDRGTPFAADTDDMVRGPGRPMSKPFAWDGYEHCWLMVLNEDNADRSYVMVRMRASTTQAVQNEPVAVVSPNQAAELRSTTSLSTCWPVVFGSGASSDPDRWFWCAPETFAGSASITEPDMSPVIHVWGEWGMLPDSPVVDGRQAFVAQGIPMVWGHGGAQELQPIAGPGKIPVEVATGSGLSVGTYTYQAIYRQVRHDGSVVRSKPSPVATVTITAGASQAAKVWVRNPRFSAVSGTTALYVDVYRNTVTTGTILYYVGTIPIPADSSYQLHHLVDALADTDLVTRETLYTIGTGGIPAAGVPSFSILKMHGGRLFGAHGRRLWYSTQRASGDGPYFPAGGFLELEEDITALGSTEAGLVIFTRRSTWLLYGDGPGPNLQPFWQPLRLIARDVGCVSQCSVYEWRDGLIFQSDRGIAILRKNGQLEHFAEPVRDWTEQYPVVRRVVETEADDSIRFLVSQGGAWPGDTVTPLVGSMWLVWNHLLDKWSTEDADGVGEFDACTVRGQAAGVLDLYTLTRVGCGITNPAAYVWQRGDPRMPQLDEWYDLSYAAAASLPKRTLKTGTIRPGGIGGWGRLRRIRLVGEPPPCVSTVVGEQVTVTIQQHSEADADVHSHHVFQVRRPLYADTADNVLLEVAPTNQLCSEFTVKIEQDAPALPEDATDSLYVEAAVCSLSNIDISVTGVGTTIDGVTITNNMTALLNGQSVPTQNGEYVAHTGLPWTRHTSSALGTNLEGLGVIVVGGVANAGTWVCTSHPAYAGSDAITFVETTRPAGEGISWTGLAFDWEDLNNRPRTTTVLRK